MTNFRDEFKQLLENTFISAKGSKEAIYQSMVAFMNKVIPNIPMHLYRYRKLSEHTLDSFEKGTISVCKAKCFSDKYDSLIFVDTEKIMFKERTGITMALRDVIRDIKKQNPKIRAEKAALICYYMEQGLTDDETIEIILKEKYENDIVKRSNELKQRELRFRNSEKTARIGCFTESVESKFMWDTYADGYQGFALDYDLRSYIIACMAKGIPAYIFPVIYSDERPDLSIDESNYYLFEKLQEKGMLNMLEPFKPFLDSNMLSPHKPFLYKDKEEYGHEREWRLLHYDEKCTNDYMEIPDMGCLKAIYYGPDIKEDDYEKLHQIAFQKGIAEYKVKIDENSRKYSLKVAQLKQ